MRATSFSLITSVLVVLLYIKIHTKLITSGGTSHHLSTMSDIPLKVSRQSRPSNTSLTVKVTVPTNIQIPLLQTAFIKTNHSPTEGFDNNNNIAMKSTTEKPPRISTFQPSGEPFDFAACLLIKDDNVILPEWLAYHYQVLPLRHLIIGLDPFSLTSPDTILDEFRKEGIDITIWQENEYIFEGVQSYNRRVFAHDTHEAKVAGYLWRQRAFMTTCIREFKQRGSIRWTVLLDTDEYLTFNPLHNDSETRECTSAWERTTKWCTDHDHRHSLLNGTHLRNTLPVIGETTIARFLFQLHQDRNPWLGTSTKPCMVVPRVLIGPEESSIKEVSKYGVEGLDPMTFHTLRYRKFKGKILPYTGKCLLDVAGYFGSKVVANPHKIFPRLCLGDASPEISTALLKVHHYTGSFETFSSHRGTNKEIVMKQWEDRVAWTSAGADDDLQGWLKSFVSNVGLNRARELTLGLRAWAFENDVKVFANNERHIKNMSTK